MKRPLVPPPSELPTALGGDSGGAGGVDRVQQITARMREAGALARYTIGGLLGRGGVGQVHAATDGVLRREVALKRIRPDKGGDEVVRRFLLEAQVTGQLEHPNVVPVYDLGVDAAGALFIVMRRVPGRSLADLVRSGQAGSLAHRLQVFLKVCDAVDYAHSRGVVHRDLKPGNVMVGDHGEVVVLDWGLAKLVDEDPSSLGGRPVTADESAEGELTSDTAVVGTPAYMPPEQALGQPIDERTDVYALGALLYALLTGRPPFDPGPDLLARVREGRFPRPRSRERGIARELEAVVLRAMARVPTERYRDVAELRADVEAWLDGREVSAHRYLPWSRVAKWGWRNRRVVGPVAAIGVLAAGTIVLSTGLYAVAALRSRDRALAAERAAEVRLAEGEVALGAALADQGRVQDAREHLRHARSRLGELGEPTTRARVAASWVEHRYPRPLLAWEGSLAARMAPDGTEVLLTTRSGGWTVSIPDGETLSRTTRDAALQGRLIPLFLGERPVGAWWTPGRWELLEIGTGASLGSFPGSSRPEFGLFVEADRSGRRVVAADEDGAAVYTLPAEAPDLRLAQAWLVGASPDLRWLWGRPREPGTELRVATTLAVWDGRTGEERWRQPYDPTFVMDDDGRVLRTRGGQLELHGSPDGPVRWSVAADVGDAGRFVAGSTEVLQVGERRARWLDARTGALLRELPTHGGMSFSVGTFGASIDGRAFVAATSQRIQLFTPARSGVLRPVGGLVAVELSPDGLLALAADQDGQILLLDAVTGSEISSASPAAAPPGREGVRDVAFSVDGREAYTADRTGAVRVIDLPSGATVRTLPPRAATGLAPIAMAVRALPGGEVAVVYEEGTIALWSRSGEVRTLASGIASAWDLAPVPGRDWLVVSGRAEGPAFSIVDLATGRASPQDGTPSARYRLAVTHDRVAMGTQSGEVGVWSLGADPQATRTLTLATGPEVVMAVALSPDGRTLASGAYDGRVQLWDLETGAELLSMRVHDQPVADLAFSADGARLLSAGNGLGVLELDLAQRLDELLPAMVPGGPTGPLAERLRDLGQASLLRGDFAAAADLFGRARAAGAAVSPIDEARALWAAGRRAEARAALDRADAADGLPGTLEAWRAAPDEPGR